MTISQDQAAEALRDIEAVSHHSRVLSGYRHGSVHFFLWGCIWTAGYLATAIGQRIGWNWQIGATWAALGIVGIAGAITIGRAQARPDDQPGWKWGVGWLVLMIFWAATYAIFEPRQPNQLGAFPAILMGTIYSVAGILWLPRYLVLGISITVLTIFGYFVLAPWFAFWMAAVGGGGMIVGGLWLRKA